MNLTKLKSFCKVVEEESISSAARSLELTQPAISMQIKSLEDIFSDELVIRQGGEMKLTAAGKVVYRRSKQILNYWEQTKLEVEQITGKTYGQLTIGASTIPSEYLLPELLADFCSDFPQVEILMKTGDSAEMISKLKDREVDMVIVGSKPKNKRIKTISVVKDHLVLILPKEHRLANKKQVSIRDLEKERMLIREEGSGTRKAMLAGLKEAGVSKYDLNIMSQLGSTEAIISAVEAGLGISFVSELAAKKAVSNNRVEQINVAEMSIGRKLYLAYHIKREDELLIKEFTNLLVNFCDN